MGTTRGTTEVPRRNDTLIANPAANRELKWFFNGAESAIETPSNVCFFLSGMNPVGHKAVERRAEAMHAASKINGWIQALPAGFPARLSGLYTQRTWPPGVRRALGRVAGVVVDAPIVRMRYVHALAKYRTKAKTVVFWLDELVEREGRGAVAQWRHDAERNCALALRSYEHVRGSGECAVPPELLGKKGERW